MEARTKKRKALGDKKMIYRFFQGLSIKKK
jgi:hypothetical protein